MPTRLLWSVVMFLVLPGLLMAQDSPLDFGITLPPSLNFATSPNPVGSGARAAGWGFAFIAVADDATADGKGPGQSLVVGVGVRGLAPKDAVLVRNEQW